MRNPAASSPARPNRAQLLLLACATAALVLLLLAVTSTEAQPSAGAALRNTRPAAGLPPWWPPPDPFQKRGVKPQPVPDPRTLKDPISAGLIRVHVLAADIRMSNEFEGVLHLALAVTNLSVSAEGFPFEGVENYCAYPATRVSTSGFGTQVTEKILGRSLGPLTLEPRQTGRYENLFAVDLPFSRCARPIVTLTPGDRPPDPPNRAVIHERSSGSDVYSLVLPIDLKQVARNAQRPPASVPSLETLCSRVAGSLPTIAPRIRLRRLHGQPCGFSATDKRWWISVGLDTGYRTTRAIDISEGARPTTGLPGPASEQGRRVCVYRPSFDLCVASSLGRTVNRALVRFLLAG